MTQDEEEGGEEGDKLRDWGTSRSDYYNADVIETEADALEEEREARRLQQKLVQNLTEEDFGFDQDQWVQEEEQAEDQSRGGAFTEQLPDLQIREDASSEEKAQILKQRYPEFEPLAKQFVALQTVHKELSLASEAAEAALIANNIQGRPGVCQTPVATCKLRALSAYMGTIGMYFALLTSTKGTSSTGALAMAPTKLRDHPIIQTLYQSMHLWEKVKDVALPEIQLHASIVTEDVHTIRESDINVQNPGSSDTVQPRQKRTRAERAKLKAQNIAEGDRVERVKKAEAKLANLDSIISDHVKQGKPDRTSKTVKWADDSDFGDEDALTTQEAADKALRKKSLRFYTSQIAQKSNKRGAASRDAGGDADLPYKERIKDRQARLMREAEQRGQAEAGERERLDGGSRDDDDQEAALAEEIRGGHVDPDSYYDLISSQSRQKKDDKKAFAQAQARAAKEGGQVQIQEEVGPDGKRAISYAIIKNRGLTPRRRKEIRNPRVKKKVKYEQKVKKLATMRPVYKGGEGRGGYGGELTGIKTNVLKGTKL